MLRKMNYKGHHSISIEDALEFLTGKSPDPIEICDPILLEQKEREGEMRRNHRITQRAAWLEQLRRFHPNAAIPSE